MAERWVVYKDGVIAGLVRATNDGIATFCAERGYDYRSYDVLPEEIKVRISELTGGMEYGNKQEGNERRNE